MIKIDSELIRLVMRIGYAAAWNGLFDEALKIFTGVSAVRRESEVPMMGIAVVGFISGNLDLAQKALDEALKISPESDLVKAHHACLLRLLGKEEEGQALFAALENSQDPDAKSMSQKVKNIPTEELFNAGAKS
jgi:Flp pilus assembly protein TadD